MTPLMSTPLTLAALCPRRRVHAACRLHPCVVGWRFYYEHFHFFKFIFSLQLTFNVLLISDAQHSD